MVALVHGEGYFGGLAWWLMLPAATTGLSLTYSGYVVLGNYLMCQCATHDAMCVVKTDRSTEVASVGEIFALLGQCGGRNQQKS